MDVKRPTKMLLYLLLIPVSVRCYCESFSWGESGTLVRMCRAGDVTANSVIYLDTSGGLQNIQGACQCTVTHSDYPNTTSFWVTVVGHASTTPAFQIGDYFFKKDLKLLFDKIASGIRLVFHKSKGQGESPLCIQLRAATNQQTKPTAIRVVCYDGQKYGSPPTTQAPPIKPVAAATKTIAAAAAAEAHYTTSITVGATNGTRLVDNGETGGEGGNAGVIAGVVVGVLVLAAAAVAVVVAYKKRTAIIGRLTNTNVGKNSKSGNNNSESGSASKVPDSTRTTENLVFPQQESVSQDEHLKGKLACSGYDVDAYYMELSNDEGTPQCDMTEDGYVDVDGGYECPKSSTGYVYGDIGVKGSNSGYVYGDIGVKGCGGTVALH